MLCCAVDPSPLIRLPWKEFASRGDSVPVPSGHETCRAGSQSPSAPLAVPLHDNPRERKRSRGGIEKEGGGGKCGNNNYHLHNSNFCHILPTSTVPCSILTLPLFFAHLLHPCFHPLALLSLSICLLSVVFLSLSLMLSAPPPAWNRLL